MPLELALDTISDQVVRENFYRIERFIAENMLTGTDFKFFEVDVPTASYSFPIKHGLSFTPTDIIPLAAEGDYNYYFRTQDSDQNNIYVATHGPVRLRFLLGKLNQTGRRALKNSALPFVAPNIGQTTGTLSGAGSDGWAFIQDAGRTRTNPMMLKAGVRTLMPNDALGTLTNYENAPANANSWWDPSNSRFWPSHIGEFYTFRLNWRIKPALNNMNVTLDLDIGTANSIATKTFYLTKGAGNESMFSEALPTGITQGPYSNGIAFMIRSDCDAQLYGINLTIIRDYHL
jgi:hypothetical protein